MPDIRRRRRPRAAVLATAALSLALTGLAPISPAHAATVNTTITVDGTSPGRTFDGVGAISGGGGNTRLLVDYPATQRNQILDYLFKPGHGADLQILKAEIGGDTNSTDGAESSIEHTQGTINCSNGYEWWLMQQAKARNPNIKLYGLAWGAPGWVGSTFWTTNTINYLISWLGCAKQNGLSIDYLGGWNERSYNISWYEQLRSTLNANGYSAVKIVGADDNWNIANDIDSNSTFASSVDIIGTHYPCGYLTAETSCPSTSAAVSSGKQLWASENGSEDAELGAAATARGINRGYLDGQMTAYINWPVVASIYPELFFNDDGLITANQPWSGAYTVGRTTWAIAQTTQFTAPGWQYLNTASGYLGGSRSNGSYVSYASPDRSAWSTVFETMDATASQTVSLSVTGGLPSGSLHVWSTDLSQPGAATPHMVQNTDLTATSGSYQLTLAPGHIYTVTTTTGQGAGTTTSPQRSILPLPYSDSFANYTTGQEATYFATMNGAFQAEPCQGGRSGNCLRQMAPTTPIRWTNEPGDQPYTLMGDLSWSNYTVGSDVLLEQSSSAAEILGRVVAQNRNNNGLNAYHLRLADTGAWSLLKTDSAWNWTTLASGTVTAPGTGTWHHLALGFQGTTITAAIDGTTVATVTDASYTGGQVGLGTAGYYPVEYSNFSVTPGTTTALSGKYNIVNVNSGQLMDASGGKTADGTPILQWPSTGATNQQWTVSQNSAGYYTITGVASGKALDIPNVTTWPGTQLELWTPNGGTNQQWLIRPTGDGTYTIESRSDGDVLDVAGASSTNGATIDQWYPNGNNNQLWTLVPVS
ncbi:MAG TPA: RICIN domain-containing protein [Actinocrinis sp.]|uniref:RICIN domain-containing protein n=1 Tax=Actinocrinis sp. TaxID=1920516 RepID=UPI002D53352D|nr:RICIN domain-containing protein [Actinocrinis sp.]HZU55998.1 RICIN domain-containing protein [Actinocrinis sp.]